MSELVDATVLTMAPQYPELNDEHNRVRTIAVGEEATFLQTLRTGTTIFDTAAAGVRAGGGTLLSGDQAFALHDTYGFPIDLTLEMASEQGLAVDEPEFRRLMQQQRERAKADSRARKSGLVATTAYRDILQAGGTTTFTGYDESQTESLVIGIVKDGETVPAARVGEHVEIVLNRTPFYAEAGGQLGDHGALRASNGATVDVYDVQTPVPGLFIHRGEVLDGELVSGTTVISEVDAARRRAISRAHTATHMIHRAFRERLGDTATQMGSENAPGRLRFDFPNPTPVSASVLQEVEQRVNEVLIDDLVVTAHSMSQPEARALGAMALFGEKYGDSVRVVSVGDWAHELCGGTHAQRSGQLGVVTFLSEGSIGAGVRRVEALVGADAYQFLAREHLLVNRLSELVKAPADQLVDRVEKTIAALKGAERDLAKTRRELNRQSAPQGHGPEQLGAVEFYWLPTLQDASADELRTYVVEARPHGGSPAVAFGTAVTGGVLSMVASASASAVELGVDASELIRAAARLVDGRGGGKPNLAQGGGKATESLSDVEAAVKARIATWTEQ
jgi:alanyl-tRNA synthetase